jgi:hypothetical protein
MPGISFFMEKQCHATISPDRVLGKGMVATTTRHEDAMPSVREA